MRRIFVLVAILLMLSGCTDRNMFLLQCNTRGFLNYRDLTFKECRCVADSLEKSLSVDEFSDMNDLLRDGKTPSINSNADITLRDAGRKCVNILKQ